MSVYKLDTSPINIGSVLKNLIEICDTNWSIIDDGW